MTLFSDFLTALGVPHTEDYSDRRFNALSFRSLYGLSKLLGEYGVASQGLVLEAPVQLSVAPTPFLAATPAGLVIVTSVHAGRIEYLTQGVREAMPLVEFAKIYTGRILVARADRQSREPGYAEHARTIFFTKAKRVVLVAALAFVLAYFFVVNGIWHHASAVLVAVFDVVGLYFCYLLMGKTLKVHNAAADRVCGVLQKGGCDHVLADKSSTFFGIFSWSEVGFTYFSVSLITLVAVPSMTSWLAAINVCCLPFTVWSISYQKFVIKHWCTLCVCVQTTLWLLFACYLGGGWLKGVFPLGMGFFVLVLVYAVVLLAINRLTPYLTQNESD